MDEMTLVGTNEKGNMFYIGPVTATIELHAQRCGFPDVRAYLVKTPSGYSSYVLAVDQQIIFDSQKLEDVACKLDVMKLVVDFTSKSSKKKTSKKKATA